MFGRKKNKKTKVLAAKKENTKKDPDQVNYDEVQIIRPQLNFFGKFAGDKEIDKMVKMKKTAAEINKHMRLRFTNCFIFGGIFTYLGFTDKSSAMMIAIFGLLFIGVYWFMDMRKVGDYYESYSIQRQIAFSRFVQMAAAYAPEAKSGTSMFSILKKVIPRMYDQEDQDNLARLLIDAQPNPDNQQPFADFADAYPVSETAMTVMLVIQHMFQGDVSDENIRSLAEDANQEVTKQMGTVITRKLARMDFTNMQIALSALIPVMTYILTWVFQIVLNLMASFNFKM